MTDHTDAYDSDALNSLPMPQEVLSRSLLGITTLQIKTHARKLENRRLEKPRDPPTIKNLRMGLRNGPNAEASHRHRPDHHRRHRNHRYRSP